MVIGAGEIFSFRPSSQTALLAGNTELLSEPMSSPADAMCGTTSSTPLVALALLEKHGLWRGGRGRCAASYMEPRESEAVLLKDEAIVDGLCVRDGMEAAPPPRAGRLAELRWVVLDRRRSSVSSPPWNCDR